MISDTIYKARTEIAEYREQYPDAYDQYAYELNELEKCLGRLAILLDTPPRQDIRSVYQATWAAAAGNLSDIRRYP